MVPPPTAMAALVTYATIKAVQSAILPTGDVADSATARPAGVELETNTGRD